MAPANRPTTVVVVLAVFFAVAGSVQAARTSPESFISRATAVDE